MRRLVLAAALLGAGAVQAATGTVVEPYNDRSRLNAASSFNYDLAAGALTLGQVDQPWFGDGVDGDCTVAADTDISTASCSGRFGADAVSTSMTGSASVGALA